MTAVRPQGNLEFLPRGLAVNLLSLKLSNQSPLPIDVQNKSGRGVSKLPDPPSGKKQKQKLMATYSIVSPAKIMVVMTLVSDNGHVSAKKS